MCLKWQTVTWEEKAFLISCIKIQGVTARDNQRSRDGPNKELLQMCNL